MTRAMAGMVAAGLVLAGAGAALAGTTGAIPKPESRGVQFLEGHGWARYYGKQRTTVRMHHSDWSGARRSTDDAKIRVCRDRGLRARTTARRP